MNSTKPPASKRVRKKPQHSAPVFASGSQEDAALKPSTVKRSGAPPPEISNDQFETDMQMITRLPFWKPDLYVFNKCKSRTAFHCLQAHEFFKQACVSSQTIFPSKNELQRDVVEPMNKIFGQSCFQQKDTDKYVKITCLQGCLWESWFFYEEDP